MILIDTSLPDQMLDEAALRIGPVLTRLLTGQQQQYSTAELEYTLPCWFLGKQHIEEEKTLRDSATHTGIWHHQIMLDGTVQVAARSLWDARVPDKLEVTEVGHAKLATELEQTLTWLAEHNESADRLRLLLIPAFYITCLWLVNEPEDHVVVVTAPTDYQYLQKQQIYPASEFLHTLFLHPPC